MAIDNSAYSFSHTADSNAWLQVSLGQQVEVDSVEILNRWCTDITDPIHCLCRLSNATVSLLDSEGSVIASQSTGDTCDKPSFKLDFTNSFRLPSANKIKLQSTSGNPVHIFELEVYSSNLNIAPGKSVTQSSTFNDKDKFSAGMAADGDLKTFSHTKSGSFEWWEIDFGGNYSIESLKIYNRWCQDPLDQPKCLCRLSHVVILLIDGDGSVIHSSVMGDMCGELLWVHDFDTSSE